MIQFATFSSKAFLIKTENIDTDQIIPARFLKTTKREGLGKYLFYNLRFDEYGKPKMSHFNNLNYQSSQILITGKNFGCGSSREHAVWALMDFGFKTIVSSFFGDIFYTNCFKNGLLPIIITPKQLVNLFKIIEKNPESKVTIDLINQSVTYHAELGFTESDSVSASHFFHFPIDSFQKKCLQNGVDELGYLLSFESKIKEYENNHKKYLFLNHE